MQQASRSWTPQGTCHSLWLQPLGLWVSLVVPTLERMGIPHAAFLSCVQSVYLGFVCGAICCEFVPIFYLVVYSSRQRVIQGMARIVSSRSIHWCVLSM